MGLRVESEHIIPKLSPIESNISRLFKSAHRDSSYHIETIHALAWQSMHANWGWNTAYSKLGHFYIEL